MSNEPVDRAEAGEVLEEAPVVLIRRRGLPDAEMDITPMIDITFLLLIFFLVAAKMDSQAAVDLPPARYGSAVSAKNSVILVVRRGDGGRSIVSGGQGETFPSSDLAEQERRITEYVAAGLEGSPPFTVPRQQVLIKAERLLPFREVDRVMRAAGKAREGQPLNIAVLEIH